MSGTLEGVQKAVRHRFTRVELLEQALTHASAAGPGRPANERLEFLGDAVVDLLVAEHLFRVMPEAGEGRLTQVKSSVVRGRTMARVARSLGLGEALRVDTGLRERRGYPPSMLAGVYEALVGAIFLDGGIRAARRFVMQSLGPEVQKVLGGGIPWSYKSILQERAQAEGKGIPEYRTVGSEGPSHHRIFRAEVRVRGETWGTGRGRTKKEAQEKAARGALNRRFPGWDEPKGGQA